VLLTAAIDGGWAGRARPTPAKNWSRRRGRHSPA